METMWECYDLGGEWVNPDGHFDDLLNSFTTLFAVSTAEGWVSIMWRGIDARGMHLEPQEGHNLWKSLFFILFMIIGSLFLLNLFVGVVITQFNVEKDKLFRNNRLTAL